VFIGKIPFRTFCFFLFPVYIEDKMWISQQRSIYHPITTLSFSLSMYSVSLERKKKSRVFCTRNVYKYRIIAYYNLCNGRRLVVYYWLLYIASSGLRDHRRYSFEQTDEPFSRLVCIDSLRFVNNACHGLWYI